MIFFVNTRGVLIICLVYMTRTLALDLSKLKKATLANEIKAEHGSYEGVYTFAGLKNGMDFFTNGNGHELTFIIDK